MKMLGIALGLTGFCLFGCLAAQQEDARGVAAGDAIVDSFVAMDSGEARAWLYAATEDEIKNLFVQAKKEGWNAEQFSAACTQLVAQQRAVGSSIDDRHEWTQQLFIFGLAGVTTAMVIAGLIYFFVHGDSSVAEEPCGDVAAPVGNLQGVERELARLRASVVQQGARTREAINQLRDWDGAVVNVMQASHSTSSGSKHSHKPRR